MARKNWIELEWRLYVTAMIALVLLGTPVIAAAQSRSLDSEVWAIVVGAKIVVSLLGVGGGIANTMRRLKDGRYHIRNPAGELVLGAVAGLFFGWWFYVGYAHDKALPIVITGVPLAAAFPLFAVRWAAEIVMGRERAARLFGDDPVIPEEGSSVEKTNRPDRRTF